MIEFSCVYCGQQLRADKESAGKITECPACGHSVIVRKKEPGEAIRSALGEGADAQTTSEDWRTKSDDEIVDQLLPKALSAEARQRTTVKGVCSPLLPRYDDLTLFALSLAFMLLWSIDADLRTDLRSLLARCDRISFLVIMGLLGMILSFFGASLKRYKSDFEKGMMLIFAVLATAGTGVYAGYVTLQNSRGWLMLFPAWNILNGVLLLFLCRLGLVDTDCITGKRASLLQGIITVLSIAILLAACHYLFKLHWTITFSISVGYTMSLHNGIRDIFGRRTPARAARREQASPR